MGRATLYHLIFHPALVLFVFYVCHYNVASVNISLAEAEEPCELWGGGGLDERVLN